MSKKKSSKKSDKGKSEKNDLKKESGSISKKESKNKKSKSKKSSPKSEKSSINPTTDSFVSPALKEPIEITKSNDIPALQNSLGQEELSKPKTVNTLNLSYEKNDSNSGSTDQLAKELAKFEKLISPDLIPTTVKEVPGNKSKHSITSMSPDKPPNPSTVPTGDQKTEASLKISTNTISIKSFSIKKVSALKPVLIGPVPSKKQKLEKTVSDLSSGQSTAIISDLKNGPLMTDATSISTNSASKQDTKLSETLHLISKIESFDVIAAPPKSDRTSGKTKDTSNRESSRYRKRKSSRSRSPRADRSSRKHRSKSRSRTRKTTSTSQTSTATSTAATSSESKSVIPVSPVVEAVTPKESSSSKRSSRIKRSHSRSPSSWSRNKSEKSFSKKSKEADELREEEKKVSIVQEISTRPETVVKPVEDSTTVVNLAEENRSSAKVNETVADENKTRTRTEAGTDEQQKTKSRTESTSTNLNSSRDRNHGHQSSQRNQSNYSSSRSYPSPSNNRYSYRSSRKRKHRDSSRSRSRTNSPGRRRRSMSRTLSRSSRSGSNSSSYSSSSAYSSRREPRTDKHDNKSRSRTSSISTQQFGHSSSSSYRGSGYNHQNQRHTPVSNSTRYYSSNYRSGYYNQQNGSSAASNSRYNRSNSASRNDTPGSIDDGKHGQEQQMGQQMFMLERLNSRASSLRHVKTEGDMQFDQNMQPGILSLPYDMNISQGIYRGQNMGNNNNMNNGQYRTFRGFQNQTYHHHNINSKRFYNNNPGFNANYQIINPNMNNDNSADQTSSQTNGNPLNNTNSTINNTININANGGAQGIEPGVSGIGLNGFEITMGTVADINLDDIQNDENQSDDSEFEYSSCDENLIEMYYQDPQRFNESDEFNWSLLQEPRFSFIKNRENTMFDSVFTNTENLAQKNLNKLATIFGSEQSYLKLVRQELSGADLNNDSNNFILVNCLLNRSFSKIRLGQFFNVLNQCPEASDRPRVAYVKAELDRRQKVIHSICEKKSVKVDPIVDSNGVKNKISCLDKCLDLLTKEGLLPTL